MEKKNAKNGKQPCITEVWKRHIAAETGCTEATAAHLAKRLRALAHHLQYAHAVVAFYKQDGTFKLVTATLVPYERTFHQAFDLQRIRTHFVYWDEEAAGWRTFLIENFLEWKAIV